MKSDKTLYDLMKDADKYEEDAFCPEDLISGRKSSFKEDYFDYYDDVKTSIKEDW